MVVNNNCEYSSGNGCGIIRDNQSNDYKIHACKYENPEKCPIRSEKIKKRLEVKVK